MLVEDVPSACSVSRIEGMVGVALLGTTITAGIKSTLSEYDNCYLVLDKDASVKSLKQSKSISRNIKVRFTSEDLKYLTTDKIQDLIHIS